MAYQQYIPIKKNVYDVSEVYHSIMMDIENEVVKALAYRYNTGLFIIINKQEVLEDWLRELDWNLLPPVLSEIVVVTADRFDHWTNDQDGGMFTEYAYALNENDIEAFVQQRVNEVQNAGDKLIAGPIEGTYWFARTIWEIAANVPAMPVSNEDLFEMYSYATPAFNDFTEHDFYICENMTDLSQPIIFLEDENGRQLLDGYHRIYTAFNKQLPLQMKVIKELPAPDLKDSWYTPEFKERLLSRRVDDVFTRKVNCPESIGN